jgi:quinol monooxygenase YgiN
MIIAAATFSVPPEHHEALVAAALEITSPSRAEQGCLEYEFWADLRERGRFHVFEAWATREAFEAHLATPHLKAFREARARLGVLSFDLHRFLAEPADPA